MNRKHQILGTEAARARAAWRSPLKTWGKLPGKPRLALLCLALAWVAPSLSACGQKGPLYLPAPSGAASQPSPSSSK